MLAARAQALKRLKQLHPFVEEGVLLTKLMAYCSKEAHSCVEKAAMICFVKLRILEPDDKSSLRGKTLLMVTVPTEQITSFLKILTSWFNKGVIMGCIFDGKCYKAILFLIILPEVGES